MNTQPQESEELQLLRKIDGKVDALDMKVDRIEGRAIRLGAAAGAATGGIAGGIVAISVFLAKLKVGA